MVHKDTLQQKIDTFAQENQITPLDKNSTDYFQKHIKKGVLKLKNIINMRVCICWSG
jgi:hypothetical protein